MLLYEGIIYFLDLLSMETNKKIIGNAVSAYFMLFVSGMFLLEKKNPLLKNDFVRGHTKTALLLHILFLIIAVFAYFGVGSSYDILGFTINRIIVTSLFLIVFAFLLYGVYKAQKGEDFTIGDFLHMTSQEKLIELKERKNQNEQEKLGLILASVPFLGYYLSGEHRNDEDFQKKVHLNLWISLAIAFLVIAGHGNLALICLLLYIVLTVFSTIIFLRNDEIMHINLEKIPTFESGYILDISLLKYLRGYLSKKDFKTFSETISEVKNRKETQEEENTKALSKLPETRFPFTLVYIPIVQIFLASALKTRSSFHWKNGFGITLLMLASFGIFGLESWVPYLVAFPIAFGI